MSFTYVMSDIHGAYEQYEQMKKKINLQKSDILYIVGDIFDRGPGTYKILKDIMENDNIILLLGNHEFSYVQIYENNNLYKETKKEKYKQVANEWMEYISDPAAGGVVTIDFLFHKIRKEQREKYLDFLASCDTEKLLNVNGRYFYLTHGSLSTYDYLRVTERINMNLLYLLLCITLEIVCLHTLYLFANSTCLTPILCNFLISIASLLVKEALTLFSPN